MKNYVTKKELDTIATYMDDDKREEVHLELAPCSPYDFLKRYLELDPGFETILKEEFSIDFDEITEVTQKIGTAYDELIGKELSFVDLDNKMLELGFHTEFDSGLDFDEISDSGVILYTVNATDESGCCNVDDHARVEFRVITRHGDDEDASATYIKITDICEA